MRRIAALTALAAGSALLLTEAATARQDATHQPTYIAFRVDGTHAIATLKVIDDIYTAGGLSAQPAAQYGFQYADAPSGLREQVATAAREGERWQIHTGAARDVSAVAERVVAGPIGCQTGIGLLLRVVPESADAFSTLPAKYFLAERAPGAPSRETGAASTVGAISAPSGDTFNRALETQLHDVLEKELPAVRADAESDIARMAASSVGNQQSWARRVRAIDDSLQRGRARLRYDVQSFHLSPDREPVHFVRAEWMVDGRQGFAASLWLRGEQPLRVIDTSTRAASWLHMPEFEGTIRREQMGLILNVFDRDHDGWGEVLIAQAGYEGGWLSLLKYAEGRLDDTGIGYSFGC